jgi:hypothetical protein
MYVDLKQREAKQLNEGMAVFLPPTIVNNLLFTLARLLREGTQDSNSDGGLNFNLNHHTIQQLAKI